MSIIKNNITIHELRQRGLPVSLGRKYIPKAWVTHKVISLKAIHKRLAKIPGSLAEEISRMREES